MSGLGRSCYRNAIVQECVSTPAGGQGCMSGGLVFPPVGIAHVTDDLVNLCLRPSFGSASIRVNTSAQPNSAPHVGSVLTILCSFALAKRIRTRGMHSSLQFDCLENAPATRRSGGESEDYVRSLADTPAPNTPGETLADLYFRPFRRVLNWGSERSGAPWVLRSYDDFQRTPAVRERILAMASRAAEFGPVVSPSHMRLPIRIKCPVCDLMDKHGTHTSITSGETPLITSRCRDHGVFSESLSLATPSYVDLNTALRDVLKCSAFIADMKEGVHTVMLDGGDWGGSWCWEVVMRALGLLGDRVELAPTRLFAPLIVDDTGAKLSKTIYVSDHAYGDLPAWAVDFSRQDDEAWGMRMERLWGIAEELVSSPRRFFRNYTLHSLMGL